MLFSASIAALFQNWEQVEKAVKVAQNSAGTAQKEQEKWAKSLQGHLDSLTTAWQKFSSDFLGSDFLKGIVDIGTGIIDTIDTIVDKIGTVPTLITSISTALSFKNIGRDKLLSLLYNL